MLSWQIRVYFVESVSKSRHGSRTMTQELRAGKADEQNHRRPDEEAWRLPHSVEAEAIDHRPSRLAEIEEARMERGCDSTRGRRQLGDVDLDRAVQQIEAEAEQHEYNHLHVPWEIEGDECQCGGRQRSSEDHEQALPDVGDQDRHRQRVDDATQPE